MISVRELRLRNWVYSYDDKKPWQVTWLEDDGTEVDPIPLTPEILEKAGFTAESKYYELGFIILIYNDDYQTLEFKIETSWAENRTIGLRYVHQLQNLYFALTGTELEINLK